MSTPSGLVDPAVWASCRDGADQRLSWILRSHPEDPLVPLDDSLMEQEVVRIAAQAVERAQQPPFCGPIRAALEATQQVGRCVSAFLDDYASEVAGDTLPSLWSIQE